MKQTYVFDTSAILTLLDNEAGADKVLELLHLALDDKIEIFISIMTVVELRYRFLRQKDTNFADQKINELYAMPINIVDFNKTLVNQTALYKSTGKMSFADACIAGTAKQLNAILVHKDPEYVSIIQDIKQLTLPFKPKKQ